MENTMSFQFSDLLMYIHTYIYIYKVKINIIKTEIIDLHYLQ